MTSRNAAPPDPTGDRSATAARPPFAERPVPSGAPDPLPEPAREELRLEAVMGALSDSLRLHIVRELLLHSDAFDHPCGWLGLDRPKSTLTHHFRALREAGLIRQRQYGLERRSHVRVDDLEARFPGLLALVAAWEG
ncbi:ArsR family transcriptional regulator [Streptomyces sp. NPDC003077]|uniref:ArsR/SmtB family transcription factor n=1 Tax=Streptomyces sp. NPDC003077 TaxID=3154443 RepID=UPI0033B08293